MMLNFEIETLISSLSSLYNCAKIFNTNWYSDKKRVVFRQEKGGILTRKGWYFDKKRVVFRLEKGGIPTRKG